MCESYFFLSSLGLFNFVSKVKLSRASTQQLKQLEKYLHGEHDVNDGASGRDDYNDEIARLLNKHDQARRESEKPISPTGSSTTSSTQGSHQYQ